MPFFEPIESYDFHIYYTAKTRSIAVRLKDSIFVDFRKEIDNDELIVKVLKTDTITGPHDDPFFEVDVEDPVVFARFFSYLQLKNTGLNVLVHPNSGAVLNDHTIHATWIGNKVGLKEEILKKAGDGYPEFGFPKRELIQNGFYTNGESKGIMIRLLQHDDAKVFNE